MYGAIMVNIKRINIGPILFHLHGCLFVCKEKICIPKTIVKFNQLG